MVGAGSSSLTAPEARTPTVPSPVEVGPTLTVADRTLLVAAQRGDGGGSLAPHTPGRSRPLASPSAAARFSEFSATRDPRLRTELIQEHHGLAQSVARRFTWPGLTTDDLLQIARIGLIHAVDRYDPQRGVAFATFATHTIAGEIKRFLRDHGWPVKIPRHLRELHLRVRAAHEALTLRLARPPSIPELARHLDIPEETVLESLELLRTASPVSLETPVTREDASEPALLGDHLGVCDGGLLDLDLRLAVRSSIDSLDEHQRQIVWLRYFHGLTQSEVAQRLSVSQMHISRLERRALARLRLLLAELLRR